jgi:hypothetical protein
MEKSFLININASNRPPINATSNPMIVYLSPDTKSTPIIVGQISIIDPDINENFTIKFNQPSFRALTPTINSYSIITDDSPVDYVRLFYHSKFTHLCIFLSHRFIM